MPPVPKEIVVFDKPPQASKETFDLSGPLVSTKESEQLAMTLFSQDLQCLMHVGNSSEGATAKYDKSVTTGFAFTTGQSVSIESSVEVNMVFSKASVTTSLTLTFSEQWSKSTTETYSVEVEPGNEAYLYQGYVRARILKHNEKDDSYGWVGGPGMLYTPAYVVTDQPLS
ncbi:hypothetical protein [Streptomyces sp. NPDC052042]|uniref:hypothetical protein n=1 Tax=Streptomyces sp. NPDC052042 TaxID=3365683 RepID=UPI0037CE6D03